MSTVVAAGGWRSRLVLLAFPLLGLVPVSAFAQAVTGTVLGTITDTSGGIVAGAKVIITNQDTNLTRTVTTDANGEYNAPQLPTGTYVITVEMTGFKMVALSNIHVGVDQRVRIDAKLEIGNLTESVTITSEAPLVQSASSELGTTINEEQIRTLPLNGRNFVSLTRTIPGVLRGVPGANIDGAGSLAWRASASFSANGQRARDNNYMLDGVDNNETWLQTVVLFPNVDALDEFKLQTSTYSAEFGRSMGGVVNLQIKSGTNALRGSAYEFRRDDALDANNFFNNRAQRPKPEFRQDQFGFTLGGPIFRDRTFFFGDYQGMRIEQGLTFLSTVPSLRMRQGDFSEINRVIYDPVTGLPFAGNIIPPERWDPASRNVLQQLYPEPNTAGRTGANGQHIENYLINPAQERQDNQFDVKIDHNLTSTNRFFTRYSFQKTHRLQPATLQHGDAGATFGAGDGNITAQGVAFNDTHSFNERWLNEFRFGWSQVEFLMTPIDYGTNLASQMGIPGVNISTVTSAMSQITFQNGGIRNLGSNGNQPLITNQNDFQIFDNVTWIKGRHTVKMGGSVTFRSREILNADIIVGSFQFNQNQTSNCGGRTGCTVLANTGFDVASFLLGYARTIDRRLFEDRTYTETRPEYAVYIQDDFRWTNNLTVNAGLRWDVFVPWVEVDDRQSNFDTSTGTFVVASPDAVMNGVQVGRYLQTYSKRDFGPRLGFAYDLFGDGRTMVRGGWGVFWNFTPGGTSSSKAQNPPFLQATTRTTEFGLTNQLSDGFPPPPGVDPSRPAQGTTRSIFDINFRDGYAHNFNINVQRQLGTNYMVEAAYAGSRGRDMMAKLDPNQAPPIVGVSNSNINRPYFTINPALTTLGQAASIGWVDYNGLLLKFQRRFANNFSFLNSYTLGKSIDINSDNDGTVSFTNVYDLDYNRGPSDYDVRHTFSSSWIYELPLYRERWYGGWQVNGILFLRSGLPFTVTQTQNVLSTGTGNRPNRICDGKLENPTIDRWFDTSCFVPPADATGTYGDSGRNILRGPGQFNIDMSLIKRTRFGRINTEIRVEAFNLLNHPQFGQPNGQIGNASVGRITAMLANPACALCGTTERQIQIAAKATF
ncbi:MAG TPA: carboxypeptidase regulatory-like domain-containing protein [Vicinamibacterales bacterium]|nr:carboxypeptidase regulatory-like domain-containing protein [Vicinamibacterales bacterium]